MHNFNCIKFAWPTEMFYFVQVTFVVLGVYGQLRQDPQTKKPHPITEVKLNWTFWTNIVITLFNYPVQRKSVFKVAQLVLG